MAKATKQPQPSEPNEQPIEAIAVSLTREEWSAMLSLVEVGIKAVGATAFEQGGALMRVVAQQVSAKKNDSQ